MISSIVYFPSIDHCSLPCPAPPAVGSSSGLGGLVAPPASSSSASGVANEGTGKHAQVRDR